MDKAKLPSSEQQQNRGSTCWQPPPGPALTKNTPDHSRTEHPSLPLNLQSGCKA